MSFEANEDKFTHRRMLLKNGNKYHYTTYFIWHMFLNIVSTVVV